MVTLHNSPQLPVTTVNGLLAASPEPSIALTLKVRACAFAGTVKLALNEPVLSVVMVLGVVFESVKAPNDRVIVEDAAKPVPLTVTVELAVFAPGDRDIDGTILSGLKAECDELSTATIS